MFEKIQKIREELVKEECFMILGILWSYAISKEHLQKVIEETKKENFDPEYLIYSEVVNMLVNTYGDEICLSRSSLEIDTFTKLWKEAFKIEEL